MKKNASRIIALALVVMMALALIPLGAHAEGTYKVHFESRSSFARGEMADVSFQDGTVTLPRCDFHPQGFAFVGWINLADESKKYANGDVITLEEAGLSETNTVLNLGAVWQEHAPVTVSFDGGGADGGAMSAVSVAYDDIYTIPACGFTRTNYSFSGWKDGEGTSYAVESGHALTADLTLIAQWTRDTVTVTLNPGEGSGEASSANHPKGTDYTVPDCDFTREGYTFSGWVGSDGSSYAPGDTLPLAADFTLTAQWQQNAVAKVLHFNANGGSAGSTPDMTSSTGVFTLPACGFSREGMHFIGWTINAVAESAANLMQPGSSFTLQEGLTEGTLYAQWEQDATGGEGSGSSTPAALTGNVSVTGTPNPGEVLTATLINTNNTGTLSYQWLKDGTPINGETAATYTVKNSDLQSRIACRVSSSVQTGSLTSTPVTAYPASKGNPGISEPALDNSVPENKIAALKQSFGNDPRIKTAVYQVTPCWNGDPNTPMTADEVKECGQIFFTLPYPAGTADGNYNFYVYHYNTATQTPERVAAEPVATGIRVSGTAFSPFIELAVPTSPAEGSVLIGGVPVVGGTLTAICGTDVTPLSGNSFQWTRNKLNIPGATVGTYKVTADDVGCRIECKVTTASGQISSANYVVPTANLTPVCTQGVFNNGETATGIISNVNTDMQYISAEDYYKNPAVSNPLWKNVTGNSITGLTKGGLYYIRLKTSPTVMTNVNVPEYYSIRVYEKVKNLRYTDANGNSTPRHGKLTPTATVLEKGNVMTVTATPNKNYAVYAIEINGKSADWVKKGHDYVVTLSNVNSRTYVDVHFVYTGSSPRTGDDSNVALWAELAALSLLGLGAVITVLKKKSKA